MAINNVNKRPSSFKRDSMSLSMKMRKKTKRLPWDLRNQAEDALLRWRRTKVERPFFFNSPIFLGRRIDRLNANAINCNCCNSSRRKAPITTQLRGVRDQKSPPVHRLFPLGPEQNKTKHESGTKNKKRIQITRRKHKWRGWKTKRAAGGAAGHGTRKKKKMPEILSARCQGFRGDFLSTPFVSFFFSLRLQIAKKSATRKTR